jgi:hypothetical protein
MLRNKTVFIVGAGASKELGVWIGSELAQRIADDLSFRFDQYSRYDAGGDKDLSQVVFGSGQRRPDEARASAERPS